MRQKKEKTEFNVKFYKDPFLMFGMIMMCILSYGLFLFIAIFPLFRPLLKSPIECIVTCFFTKIAINEEGIESSVFFRKKKMAWEDIKEMGCNWLICNWLYISTKEGELAKVTYGKLYKNKNIMQIELSKKVYKAIKHYYDKPILGMTEADEAKLLI